jgi:hypothetical protein
LIFDCDSLKFQKKFIIGHLPPLGLFFDDDSKRFIAVYAHELIVIDATSTSTIQRLNVRGSATAFWCRATLFLGHGNGEIDIWEMEAGGLARVGGGTRGLHAHSTAVTDMAFAAAFWISSATDGTIQYWDWDFKVFAALHLPESVYACEILNGRRDVIVATSTELMRIEGALVFDKEEGETAAPIDSFDLLMDGIVCEPPPPIAPPAQTVVVTKKTLSRSMSTLTPPEAPPVPPPRAVFDTGAISTLNHLTEQVVKLHARHVEREKSVSTRLGGRRASEAGGRAAFGRTAAAAVWVADQERRWATFGLFARPGKRANVEEQPKSAAQQSREPIASRFSRAGQTAA